MSRVLEAFPDTGPWARYPWAKWMDGRVHELTRGADFDMLAANMRRVCIGHAKRKGFRARTVVRGDLLVIQAVKP